MWRALRKSRHPSTAQEAAMPSSRSVLRAAAGAATLAAMCGAVGQSATVAPGPNQVAFPADWAKGQLYATVDRPDVKQYRELYAAPEVVAAVRAGKPVPDGAVLTLAAYMAQQDANGVPLKDANGRFIKGALAAVNVMQKKAGWGESIPSPIRNGDWVYQSFAPDGKANEKANLTACYQCHLPFAKDDFLTNMAKLKGTFPSQAQAKAAAGASEVAITGFQFGPGAIKIAAGQKVTWHNADDTPHQITLVGADARRSEVMLKGQSASMQFDAAGNIAYICGLHPTMKGTIEVAAK
jgi:plastocyanin